MLGESEKFSDGEQEEEYVEDVVAHAEKLAKEKWVVEDQCKWTIFEDPADELRYHRRRSRALGHFVKAFSTLREECDHLHEAGAGLQDAYERLQEENKEAIGDAAYWRELAEARAEEQAGITRPSIGTAASVRTSIAQSERPESQSSPSESQASTRTSIAQSEQELLPNEAPPELKRKSMPTVFAHKAEALADVKRKSAPGASTPDPEPPQTGEAKMVAALTSMREEATRWRKVAEQRGEELLSLRALCSPVGSPGARSWHRHSTTTSTAGGSSSVFSMAAASSQCYQKRRSCGPGSTPAAVGTNEKSGDASGREVDSPVSHGSPSSPKPGGAVLQQVHAPAVETLPTHASSPRREIVHEQDRAAGAHQAPSNHHEQDHSEPCGSPRDPRSRSWRNSSGKALGATATTWAPASASHVAESLPTKRHISFSPSPRHEKKMGATHASGEEEMQMEKLASTSSSEMTSTAASAAPISNLMRSAPTPARSSATARRFPGLGIPTRRKDAAAVPVATPAAGPSAALAAATAAQAESARALSRLSEPRTSRASVTGPSPCETSKIPRPHSGGRKSLALGAPTRKSLASRQSLTPSSDLWQDSPRSSSRKSFAGPDTSAGEPKEEPSTKNRVTDLVDVWETRQQPLESRLRQRPNSSDRKRWPPGADQSAGVDASS